MASIYDSPTGWYRELKPGEKRTFWACFGGWTLDAMDVQIFSFAIPAILAAFAITNADAGLIGTATLLTSASLIGRLGQALSGYPPLQCRCRSRARASLRNRHEGPSIMGFEDEVEQSFGRPCRQCDSRSKRKYELTSPIVPRGTSFHR
jgi:hypothetical protein